MVLCPLRLRGRNGRDADNESQDPLDPASEGDFETGGAAPDPGARGAEFASREAGRGTRGAEQAPAQPERGAGKPQDGVQLRHGDGSSLEGREVRGDADGQDEGDLPRPRGGCRVHMPHGRHEPQRVEYTHAGDLRNVDRTVPAHLQAQYRERNPLGQQGT